MIDDEDVDIVMPSVPQTNNTPSIKRKSVVPKTIKLFRADLIVVEKTADLPPLSAEALGLISHKRRYFTFDHNKRVDIYPPGSCDDLMLDDDDEQKDDSQQRRKKKKKKHYKVERKRVSALPTADYVIEDETERTPMFLQMDLWRMWGFNEEDIEETIYRLPAMHLWHLIIHYGLIPANSAIKTSLEAEEAATFGAKQMAMRRIMKDIVQSKYPKDLLAGPSVLSTNLIVVLLNQFM